MNLTQLKLTLNLLCDIWDNRENPNDDIETATEKLILKGLEHKKSMPTERPVMGDATTPNQTPTAKTTPKTTPNTHFN